MTRTSAIGVSAARAAWGVFLIAAPGRALTLGGGHDDRTSRAVLRVLGARHVVQGAVTIAAPTPAVVDAGSVVDLLHGSSAVLFALIDRRQRRYALTEAALAAGWAATNRSLWLRLRGFAKG